MYARCYSPASTPASGRVVVYCRVSSPGQNADLASQVAAMQQFCLARGLDRRPRAIVDTFSCPLYSLRRYQKELKGTDMTADGGL